VNLYRQRRKAERIAMMLGEVGIDSIPTPVNQKTFNSAKPMRELLPFLFLRGLTGTASEVDMRLLAWLANPDVNRKVFGQPIPDIMEYYGEEFYACRTGVEQPRRNAQRNRKPA
jgi:hypothetical protein